MIRSTVVSATLAVLVLHTSEAAAVQTTESAELVAPNAGSGDDFGRVLDYDGNRIVVGAPLEDSQAINAGSAYVYVRNGSSWQFVQQLQANDAGPSRRFGSAVAIQGDRLVVGALGASAANSANVVYVFERINGVWTQTQRINGGLGNQSQQGFDLALDGDRLAFTAVNGTTSNSPADSGVVFTYIHDGNSWVQEVLLSASDAASGDRFGSSVALDGDTMVVGASAKGVDAVGGAYVFQLACDVWTEVGVLEPAASTSGASFGFDVTVLGDQVVVGAPFEDLLGARRGGVYSYTFNGADWEFKQRVVPAITIDGQEFGSSVSLNGGDLVVGARNDSLFVGNGGVVYLFAPGGASWIASEVFRGSDSNSGDFLGTSVVVQQDRIVAGAPLDNDAATNGGSVYVFNFSSFSPVPATPSRSTYCVPVQPTDFTKVLSVPRFDPVRGFLTGVRFSLRSYFEGNISFENLGPSPATITWSINRSMTLRRPDGSVIVAATNSDQDSAQLPPFDGNSDFQGSSSVTFDELVATDLITVTSPGPQLDLALFQGPGGDPGMIDLTLDTVAAISKTVPGNVARTPFVSRAAAVVMVEYIFEPTGIAFCFGDGPDSMNCTSCPCQNNGPPGTVGGCLNGSGTSAVLRVTGAPSVSDDSFSVRVTDAVPNSFGILVSGSQPLPNDGSCTPMTGITSPVLRGLRCVGAGSIRHGTRFLDANGDTPNPWGIPNVSLIVQGGYTAGQTRHFQVFYREFPALPCTINQDQNTTNAVTVTFVP